MNLSKILYASPLVALGMSLATPASATTYHGFVKDEFYLVRGGTPATFEQVANDPLEVFRSPDAYEALRAHFSNILRDNLSDADFRSLLRSDQVRLVPCTGTVDTAGVTNSGAISYSVRACYDGEQLIELQLEDGRWIVAASQGCYNPVRGREPSPLPYVPAAAVVLEPVQPSVTVSYRMRRVGETVTPGTTLSVGGYVTEVFVCPADCVCEDGRIISTPRITTGGFPTTSGMFESND